MVVFGSHFWVGLIWAFQKFSIKVTRWTKTILPEVFNEVKGKVNYTQYYKETPKLAKLTAEKPEILSVEDFLKNNLMGKTQFNYDDLEDLSIKEIKIFISLSNIINTGIEQTKPSKSNLIELIKSELNIEEFNKKFFEFKKNIRISDAKQIPVDLIRIIWGPPLNCLAELKVIKQTEEEVLDLAIENDQIKHTNCHWVYHRLNFCGHLIALFLALSNRNTPKTLEYLKRFIRK